MLRTYWQRTFGRYIPRTQTVRKKVWQNRFQPALDTLGERIVPAVTASFSAGQLVVLGDAQDNNIVISRDAAGRLLVNGGAVTIRGGTPTVANTSLIQVAGQGGNDQLSLSEVNGALPRAFLFGGAGNDVLTGGSAADQLFGQAGNDTLLGKGGDDMLFGGDGNDTLTGGVGTDQVFGEAGNDRMIWNPGEGSDLNEGGAGNDTVEVNGGNGAESFTVTPNGTRVRFDRVTPAPFSLDIGTSENLVLNMNGGDDTFTGSNGLATLMTLTVDGGTGNDTITGGDGIDTLFGGDGNDFINGGRGNDVVFMGAGDDTFVWNPGDGSDKVEGQDGADTLQFNGANIGEKIDLSSNGSRLRLTRDIAAITMDLNGLERVNVAALGGADTLTINNLAGTGVTEVNLDLSASFGSGVGDGQADSIIVTGTNSNDNIGIFGQGSVVTILGLPATVNINGSEGASDTLMVNALGGDDGVTASTLPAGVINLTVDGGTGNDSIFGSQGADKLLGGDGNDFIQGNQGNDVALMGAGDDVFQWNPGDGSDTVEGQAGNDKMFFFGSNQSENFDFSANGSRVRFFRDVGSITMDLNGLEQVELRAQGGSDNIVVGDMTGTDLTQIELALRGPNGGVDGEADAVIVNGTQGKDTFGVAGDAGGLQVFGLHTTVTIFDQDPALDRLTLNGLGGNDTIDARSLKADSIQLTINGGDGDDTITGSDGNDSIIGGRGNDVMLGGAGDDIFTWNPGDGNDTMEGQDGYDAMIFNGANIGENINISANGQRLRFTRDVANIVMDADGVERVDFNALGGADNIIIGDLSATAVTEVNLNLSAIGGVGDGQPDTVTVNGTSGDDVIVAQGNATGVVLIGLSAQINITGAEAANDRLVVNAQDGDDVVMADGLTADAIQLIADGGNGDDVLIGGDGADTLRGGAGDDVLIGGPGNDLLDGGIGDNILIQ